MVFKHAQAEILPHVRQTIRQAQRKRGKRVNDCKNCQRVTPSELCSHCCVSDTNRERNTPTMWIGEKQTNADRIRAMSDEELAELILRCASCDKEKVMCVPLEYKNSGNCNGRCVDGRLNWLKQEADNLELGGDT